MKRGIRLERIADWLEVPPEALLAVARVEIIGRLQLRVENHRGLVRYDPARIVLAVPEGRLIVEGKNLVISWVSAHDIVVTGEVLRVLSEGEGS